MSRLIFGISAKSKCGKDTIADYLIKNYGFKKDSFAAPVKQVCAVLFNVPLEYFETQEGKAKINDFMGCTNRVILQVFGTELIREQLGPAFQKILGTTPKVAENGNFWVEHFLYRNRCGQDNIVVPDVRFENEAVAIRKAGGRILRHDRKNWVPDPEVDKHRSETELDNFTAFDWRASTGSVRDMLDWVDTAMKYHGVSKRLDL